MKLFNKITPLLLASLVFTACERDYDAPPLNEPHYQGADANITIAQLRELGKTATEDAPTVINDGKVLKAVITGNDVSGNIYKKIYLQDESGAIEMGVDQNSVYNYYPVGQQVYVNLQGLCISIYGDEQQIGKAGAQANRIPWVDFQEKVQKDGWANAENAKPLVIEDISTINANPDEYKFKLVTLSGVTFTNGGKNIYAVDAEKPGFTEEEIKDAHGNSLVVHTSRYANFAAQTLPAGKGNVTGILGRFRGNWQLVMRSVEDAYGFTGGPATPEQPEANEGVLFYETFGKPEKEGTYWPKFQGYTGFDNKDVTFEDASGEASVRISSNQSNVWMPKEKDITIAIKNIKGGTNQTATLEYEVGANVYDAGETQDLNTLKVRCNGTELTIPSLVVSGDKKEGNKPFKMVVKNVKVSTENTLEFATTAATNTYGIRLFSIKLSTTNSQSNGGNDNNDNGDIEIQPQPVK